eukprot:EST45398.1 Hypothetical protein SS50377_14673 [Spironucleus salmonicida]
MDKYRVYQIIRIMNYYSQKQSETPSPQKYSQHLYGLTQNSLRHQFPRLQTKTYSTLTDLGPGYYNPDYSKISNVAPSFSVGRREVFNYETQTPGPGSYSPGTFKSPKKIPTNNLMIKRCKSVLYKYTKSANPKLYQISD